MLSCFGSRSLALPDEVPGTQDEVGGEGWRSCNPLFKMFKSFNNVEIDSVKAGI